MIVSGRDARMVFSYIYTYILTTSTLCLAAVRVRDPYRLCRHHRQIDGYNIIHVFYIN